MSMRTPLITVLMPVYNAAPYLNEAIDSILFQTFSDFEFLIINDGSTDNSEEIILSYKDDRIRYVKNEQNIKLIATLNKGIALSSGKYIARMDADDISLSTRLEKQFLYMEAHTNVGLLGMWYESFDKNGICNIVKYVADHNTICYKQLYQIQVSHGTCMFRKRVLIEHGLLFDPLYSHAEDYDLFSRMSALTELHNLTEVGYRVRLHENEVSRLYSNIQTENSNKVRHRLFTQLGLPVSSTQLDLFIKLNHQDYSGIAGGLAEVTFILSNIVLANQKTQYINSLFLADKIALLWFNYCYNKESLNTYFSSPLLSTRIPVSLKTRIKWRIKQFLKK
jgi:glycosyltransferase involved in cell wall biosynthesis